MPTPTPVKVRVTKPVRVVLQHFLGDPDRPLYGRELMKRTSLLSGTLYPILTRLHAAGWLDAETEAENPADPRLPRRTFYRLTELGRERANIALQGWSRP